MQATSYSYYLTTEVINDSEADNNTRYTRARVLSAVRNLQPGQRQHCIETIAQSHELSTFAIAYLLTFRDAMIKGELSD